jgi:hypothetical protein
MHSHNLHNTMALIYFECTIQSGALVDVLHMYNIHQHKFMTSSWHEVKGNVCPTCNSLSL